MLLFAYGSHACPYGDWSKEEKLTYVGGLFSCSLQVNFSSFFYWEIGETICLDVLNRTKADYGKGVVDEVSERLTQEYGICEGAVRKII